MGSIKIVLPSLLFVFFFAANAESTAISATNDHGEAWLQNIQTQFPRFSYLGQVGGKRFYVDFTLRNRDDSVKFCESWGMSIARVLKRTEGIFLRDNLLPPNNVSHHLFWVDGEDVQNLNQLKYKSGAVWRTEVETRFFRHSCSNFARWQNGTFYLENYYPCSSSWNVLCEI